MFPDCRRRISHLAWSGAEIGWKLEQRYGACFASLDAHGRIEVLHGGILQSFVIRIDTLDPYAAGAEPLDPMFRRISAEDIAHYRADFASLLPRVGGLHEVLEALVSCCFIKKLDGRHGDGDIAVFCFVNAVGGGMVICGQAGAAALD